MIKRVNDAIRDLPQHEMAPLTFPLTRMDGQLSFIASPVRGAPRPMAISEVRYFLEEIVGFMRLYGYVECTMQWEIAEGSNPKNYFVLVRSRLSISN